MVRACAQADIVVADRGLPRGCTPRWLRADRFFLRRTGGLAITLGETAHVATVAQRVGRHPWAWQGD
jgi:competence protein ComEC